MDSAGCAWQKEIGAGPPTRGDGQGEPDEGWHVWRCVKQLRQEPSRTDGARETSVRHSSAARDAFPEVEWVSDDTRHAVCSDAVRRCTASAATITVRRCPAHMRLHIRMVWACIVSCVTKGR